MNALNRNGDFHGRPHRPVLYQVIDRDGNVLPPGFTTASKAFEYAQRLWPDQEQDEDRTGKGWDIQVADAAS